MMKRAADFFLSFCLLIIAEATAQQAAVHFDLATGVCTGEGSCEVRAGCGRFGGDCAVLTATDATSAVFATPSIAALAPGTSWLFTVHAKCDFAKSSDEPYFGVGDTAVGATPAITTSVDRTSGWKRYDLFARLSSDAFSRTLRIGIYQNAGTCSFDGVSASPAAVREVSFPPFGPLGRMERIHENGTYSAKFGARTLLTGYHRAVVKTADWNNHYRLFAGRQIVLNHTLGTAFTSAPSVVFSCDYSQGGFLLLEASPDGSTWALIANTTGVFSARNFSLPSSQHAHVRFTSVGGSNYVTDFEFRAATQAPPFGGMIVGREVIIALDSIAQQTAANISVSMGSISNNADYNQTLPVLISSATSSSSSISLSLQIAPWFSRSTMSFDPSTVTVAPGSSATANLQYHLAGAKQQFASFSLSSSSGTLVSGRFYFWPSHFLLDTSVGKLLSDSASAALWWTDGSHQIYKHRAPPTTPAAKIALSLARNEKEPVQLAVFAKSRMTISSVTVGTLAGPGGNTLQAVSVRRLGHIITQNSDYNNLQKHALLGVEWPDMLYPYDLPIVCEASTNCAFWILFAVGHDAAEGTYSGSINVQTSAGTLSCEIDLRVWNVTIPRHSRLTSWIGIYNGRIWPYHHMTASTNAEKRAQYLLYFKALEEHRMSPSSPVSFDGISSRLVLDQNGEETWELLTAAFDASYDTFFTDEGFGFMHNTAHLKGIPSGNYLSRTGGVINGIYGDYPWGSANHTRLFAEYALKLQNYFESKGLLDKTTIYWFDEPLPADYPWIREVNLAIHNAAPKLKRMLTEQVEPELVGFVDTWCPGYSNYDFVKSSARQMAGEKVWIYKGVSIDYPAIEPRIWMWMIYKYHIDAFLHWESVYWTSAVRYNNSLQDPYEDALGWSGSTLLDLHFWSNGEGRLFYPPVNWKTATSPITNVTPVETMRLENFRDGLEDWELLMMLQELLDSRPRLPAELRVRAQQLVQVPETMLVEKDWIFEPDELLERRDAIASLLEEAAATEDAAVSDDSQVDGATCFSTAFFVIAVAAASLAIFL